MERNIENEIYLGANGRKSLIDLTIPSDFSGKTIVFIHGYMGFKDWGAWNLVKDYFVNLGFGFCKYNVSHNGCSIEKPIDFVDLDAFSENNYTKEGTDFQHVLRFLEEKQAISDEIYVIGHSRGGGIALLQGHDARVKKVVTWAAISSIAYRFPKDEALDDWKKNGFYYRKNGRTNQEMPHAYSQYEDFLHHKSELNIQSAVEKLNKPLLLIHGDADTSVAITEGEDLALWSKTKLKIIPGANHTFGSKHPSNSKELPGLLENVCEITSSFFNEKV